MSANPPVTTITSAPILAAIIPIIEATLGPAIDAALAAGGPVAEAVAATFASMIPVILSQVEATQNTPAQAAALSAALAGFAADIAAAQAAGKTG